MPAKPIDLFRTLTNGVYVVSAAHEGRADAFTAAWITQVSFEPLLVALSVNPANATWPLLQGSGAFTVHVLRDDQLALARHFGTQSGRDVDKLGAVTSSPGRNGAPAIDGVLARLECRVELEVPAGDHVLVLARVTGGDVLDETGTSLRYSDTGEMDGAAALYPASLDPRA